MGGKSEQSNEPWEGQRSFLTDAYTRANLLSNRAAPAHFGDRFDMRADPNQNQYQAAWMMGDRGRNPAAYETAAHNWSRSTANQIAPSMHETQVASNVAMLGANRGLGAMLTHSQGVGFGTAGGVARDGTRHWRDMATQKIGKAKDYGTAASNIGYGD